MYGDVAEAMGDGEGQKQECRTYIGEIESRKIKSADEKKEVLDYFYHGMGILKANKKNQFENYIE